MIILHTSDWHLGHTLYGYDRMDDHMHFFSQLKDIVKDKNPDALLVSGDIFDISYPSAYSQKIFTDFLLELHEIAPDMTIIVTSGNHDSASRIDVNRNLWKSIGIHVIGNVKKTDGVYDFTDNIISLPGKGCIAAIPFINRAFLSKSEKDEKPERLFFDSLSKIVIDSEPQELPCVLMAHLTVRKNVDGERSKDITGNVNAVGYDIFNSIFDYVALGHIHFPHDIDDMGRVRYSGSPIAIGFDEAYPHSVTLINVEKGNIVSKEEMIIKPLHNLVTFPSTAVDFKTAIKRLKKYPGDLADFIRLNVVDKNDLPADCQEQATEAVKGKACKFCVIKYNRERNDNYKNDNDIVTAAEFSEMTPSEVAKKLFESYKISEENAVEYLKMISELENEYRESLSI